MRLALVQDQLLTCAGSERVFLHLAEEFPTADLYTLAYNPQSTWPGFAGRTIRTSVLDRWIRTHEQFKKWFPLATYVMQWWDFRGYDAVLTSSATVAKYIRRRSGPHVCYCYFPTRALWDRHAYFGGQRGWKELLFFLLLPYLRYRDLIAARGVDRFISISKVTEQAVHAIYSRDSVVVPSPIDFDTFAGYWSAEKEDFYLIVSRLELWKRVDYAIEAFRGLERRLKVVGTGSDMARLQALAGPNVEFLGQVDNDHLAALYGKARAVIFTPELEYGLVPLEANAAGTPCIAYGRGGALETMIGLSDPSGRPATAVFFETQTPEAVVEAIHACESAAFDAVSLRTHASHYNASAFGRRIRELIEAELASSPHTVVEEPGRP